MKKKIFIVVSVTAVAILYYFSVSGLKGTEKTQSAVSSTTQDTFTNCIFNTGYSVMRLKPELNLFTNLDSFNALNFNAIQWYDWAGSDSFGRYDVPDLTPTQINNFNNAINTVNNKDLLGFYERSFLSYYCYGQRLIYEVPSNNNDITTNYGFVYKNIETGTITTDEGRSVIYADSGQDNQGYLCKNINENLQHTDLFSFRQDDKEKWYLKPVMKIPVNVNDTTRVVRVEIISFDGSPLDSIIIKAENFRNKGIYSDDYFGFGLQHNLQVYGDQHGTDPYLSKGITDPWENWDDNCKIDFRVYWYGLCDVWFDQMIVDDQRANYLFNLQNQGLVNERIIKEAESFANTPGNYSFFMDEVTISQVPCMKYVFEKMRDSVPDVKISFATTDYLHIRGLKKDSLPYTVYFDSLQPSFLQQDAHKFDMWSGGTILPESIPEEDRDPLLNPDLFETIELYNTRLQTQALGYKTETVSNDNEGSILHEIYKVYNSKTPSSSGIKFIMQPQIHGYYKKDEESEYYNDGLREPTNEEIQVQAMISIAHGVNGLCWYVYGSEIQDASSLTRSISGDDGRLNIAPNDRSTLYTYGLLDPTTPNQGVHRHNNCYGQDKWTYVSQMNAKINNWTNVLNNANWVDGYSVHQEGANHEYILDIKSKVPLINGQNPCNPSYSNSEYFDCSYETYWEEGFFEPQETSDLSKYFIMVNRRCVPPAPQLIGDARILRIKFDSTKLQGFNNWIIKDVHSNQSITFNKRSLGIGGYLNLGDDTASLGYFLPGEGKLFKLAPVMQEGGTFVCDEEVSTSTFTCNGTVFNNGYDLTISPNTTITFSNNAGIEMNGGSFECGEYSTEDNMVMLNGSNIASGVYFARILVNEGKDFIAVKKMVLLK